MRVASSLLMTGMAGLVLFSSCRAYQRGEERAREIAEGPAPIPVGAPRDYARYGIKPDGDDTETTKAWAYESKARQFPVAEATAREGYVRSPYEPHTLINVEGFQSGMMVKDPETGEIFRVP